MHILWGGGADQIAAVFEDQTSLARLAASVRRHVDSSNRQLEVTWLEEADAPTTPLPSLPSDPELEDPEQTEEEEKDERNVDPSKRDDPNAPAELTKDPKAPKPDPKFKPAPNDQKDPPKPTTTPEPDKPKPEADKKPTPPEPAPEPPAINLQRRVSVKQHVADKSQAENPNAKYQGDEANHVAQETQSRITSTDQDDPNPTPGLSHLGPDPKAGNANVNDIAQSESSPGDPDDALSNSSKDGKDAVEQ